MNARRGEALLRVSSDHEGALDARKSTGEATVDTPALRPPEGGQEKERGRPSISKGHIGGRVPASQNSPNAHGRPRQGAPGLGQPFASSSQILSIARPP
eukprot:2678610-Pyramimonas_sp.AAC.1